MIPRVAQSHQTPPSALTARLLQRLTAAAGVLLDQPPLASPDGPGDRNPAYEADALLDHLVEACRQHPSPDRIWMLYIAVTGSYPTADAVAHGVRLCRLGRGMDTILWLLDASFDPASWRGAVHEIAIVTDRVVVDCNHSARYTIHTGVQRVVRSTLPGWVRDHDALPVAWTDPILAFRALSTDEWARVMSVDAPAPALPEIQWDTATEESGSEPDDTEVPRIVVPWRTVVVLPEPIRELADPLACMGQYSGNSVVVVGHDCIPVVSGDLVHEVERNRFARFLNVVKHAKRVAAVSRSAAAEFGGFAEAVGAQGLPGPIVRECPEPVDRHTGEATSDADRAGVPVVLSVGSLEPRKNQEALLYAAERLWREGLRFELHLVGGGGWLERIKQDVERLRANGRPASLRLQISDDELAAEYRRARFLVLPSLHEGFGLPLAEALSYGTPVITSNFGSTREIGEGGGALLIDPRDDEELVAAMRLLLADEDRWQELRAEIAQRPVRTWAAFADDLWNGFIQPELDALAGSRSS